MTATEVQGCWGGAELKGVWTAVGVTGVTYQCNLSLTGWARLVKLASPMEGLETTALVRCQHLIGICVLIT